MIRAYIAIVEKYEEQNPHLKYDVDGLLFVNQKLEKFKDNRVLYSGFLSEIAEVDRIKSYDFRHMYASNIGNSKSLIISVETQQQTFVSKCVNEWRALSSQQGVKEKLMGRSSGSL